MTGPEHYREAERRAAQADALLSEWEIDVLDDRDGPQVEVLRAQAEHAREMGKLHAMLAQAAATAMNDVGMSYSDRNVWHEVAGVQSATEPQAGGAQ